MFHQLAQIRLLVWISAFETKPTDLDSTLKRIVEKHPGTTIQLVDLDRVAGSRYILLSVLNAVKSFQSKQPISKTLGMEMLLYIAATRQIGEAIQRVGINPSTERTAAILVGESTEEIASAVEMLCQTLGSKSDEGLVDRWSPERMRNVKHTFEIGDLELRATRRSTEKEAEAIERLAIERSALLTIRK